ncbi:MAG: hypothetical protein ACAI38_01680 [Myxococcota bacterium]
MKMQAAEKVSSAAVQVGGSASTRFAVVGHDPALTVQVLTYPFGIADIVLQGTQQNPFIYSLDGRQAAIAGQKTAVEVALALANALEGSGFAAFPWLVTETHAGVRLVPVRALKNPDAVNYLNKLPRRA